ncbi:hypothetical protein N8T08_007528 [Aspergillus melleus]|uniref:Uncharacterized protein n=1 Tax=Aspergillus melleus TaxID=138277 RepID=A0ACC3AYF7_9EURO|nr:hypothetical protein N8T08_007528 [Aspergillus melleus]
MADLILTPDTLSNLSTRLEECESNLTGIEENMTEAMQLYWGRKTLPPYDDPDDWSLLIRMTPVELQQWMHAEMAKAEIEFGKIKRIKEELAEVKHYLRTSNSPIAMLARLRDVEKYLEDLPSNEDSMTEEEASSDEDSPSEEADAHASEVLARFATLPELPVSKDSEDESPSNEDFLSDRDSPSKEDYISPNDSVSMRI